MTGQPLQQNTGYDLNWRVRRSGKNALAGLMGLGFVAACAAAWSAITAEDYGAVATLMTPNLDAAAGSAPPGAVVQVSGRPRFTSVAPEGVRFADAFKVERRVKNGKHLVDDHAWVSDDFELQGWKVPARFLFKYPTDHYHLQTPGVDIPAPPAWHNRGGPIMAGSDCFKSADSTCKVIYRAWYGYTPWTIVAQVEEDDMSLGEIANPNVGARWLFDGDLALVEFGDFSHTNLLLDEARTARQRGLLCLLAAAGGLLPQLAAISYANAPLSNTWLLAGLLRVAVVVVPLALAQVPVPAPYGIVTTLCWSAVALVGFIAQFFWPRRKPTDRDGVLAPLS